MNEHTERLMKRILHSIELYEEKKVDEKELLQNVESISGAIEERHVQRELDMLAAKIEESLYLYDVSEGKDVLLNEIERIREFFVRENEKESP